MADDAFHPDLSHPAPAPADEGVGRYAPLRHVRAADLDAETAQTAGMRRLAAICARTAGSSSLWMGQTHVGPAQRSGDHHHGESETAIYVVSGSPEFVFFDEAVGEEVRLRPQPGDYVFVPPWTPHREENNNPDTEAVVVIARSTQEAVVVNLPSLRG